MVFVTGDCHGEFKRFSTGNFPAQKELTREDIVIVCGDFGLWHDDSEERYWLNWLEQKPFTTVFVDGNHENFDRLYSGEFETVDFHGGRAQRIREHIYHLLRGHVFDFEGRSFWCFGGARSHDIDDGILDPADYETREALLAAEKQWARWGRMFRVRHESWWPQELPTREEMDFGLATLRERGFKVDYIITHCCPRTVARGLDYEDENRLTAWFDEIARQTEFSVWHFGHHHETCRFGEKYRQHYRDIERLL